MGRGGVFCIDKVGVPDILIEYHLICVFQCVVK